MSLNSLLEKIPDTAKDIRLNLSTVLTTDGAPDLTEVQIAGVALAAAYATRHDDVVRAVLGHASPLLGEAGVAAAQSAAAVMAMNNVYYRFVHTMSEHDAEWSKMPAKLRMTVLANPSVPKLDFELMSLGVSAINGCGMCMTSHAHAVEHAGATRLAVQSTVRIAAVITAVAQALRFS